MKKKLIVVLSMVSLLLLTSCGNKNNNNNNTAKSSANTTQSAEADSSEDKYNSLGFNKFDFSATALDNVEYNTKMFENSKVTMINFWGTFCGPCKKEIPDIQALSEKYDKKDFQVLGVVIDTFEGSDVNIDTAKSIIKDDKVTYVNIVPNESLYNNYIQNSIQAVPTTIFVDKDGNLIGDVLMGAQSEKALQEIVDGLIASQSK